MRLPLSMRRRFSLARKVKRDQIGVLESRLSEFRAQRGLTARRIVTDWFGLALAGLHIRLLPDDVIDISLRERLLVGKMHRVAEIEQRALRHLAAALRSEEH